MLLLGLLNTVVYAGQFVLYRAIGSTQRSEVLPDGYYKSLEYLRNTSARDAVIVDPTSLQYKMTLWTVDVAERRISAKRILFL